MGSLSPRVQLGAEWLLTQNGTSHGKNLDPTKQICLERIIGLKKNDQVVSVALDRWRQLLNHNHSLGHTEIIYTASEAQTFSKSPN